MNFTGAVLVVGRALLLVFLLPMSGASASNWDVVALDIGVYKHFWNGNSWVWEPTSTIAVGDSVKIKCFYMVAEKPEPVYPYDWMIHFTIGGTILDKGFGGRAGYPPPTHAAPTSLTIKILENLQVGLGSDPKTLLGKLDVGKQNVTCSFNPQGHLPEGIKNNNKVSAVVNVTKTPPSPHEPSAAPIPAAVTPQLVFIGAYPTLSAQATEGTNSIIEQTVNLGTPVVNTPGESTDSSLSSSPAQSSTNSSVQTENACALSVPYLKVESPIIETAASDLRQGDVFRVICKFRADLKNLSWPNCDADTARKVAGYHDKIARSSAARYSGMLDVDGATVRVVASPPAGLGDFDIEHFWVHNKPGTFVLSCKIDNVLQQYVTDSGRYIEASTSVSVGPRVEGRKAVDRADLPPSGQAARVQTAIGGLGAVNPRLNPQPEVPSAKSPAGTGSGISRDLPAVQGRDDGSGAVNPRLNPQPEVPSAKQPGGTDGVSTNVTGKPSALSALSSSQTATRNNARNPSIQSALPGSEYEKELTRPSPSRLPDYVEPPSKSVTQDGSMQSQARIPIAGNGSLNSGVMNQNVDPVGLPVDCAIKSGMPSVSSISIANTTRQRLDKGTPVNWTVYRQGSQWNLGGGAKKIEAAFYGKASLNDTLAVGQAGLVGVFKSELAVSYLCKASVFPVSKQRPSRPTTP